MNTMMSQFVIRATTYCACILATALASAQLRHTEQIAPSVYAAGFADRYQSANCGWIALAEEIILVDLPRGVPPGEFLAQVRATTNKPATTLLLTHAVPDDLALIAQLRELGIKRVCCSPGTQRSLAAPAAKTGGDTANTQNKSQTAAAGVEVLKEKTSLGSGTNQIEFLPLDEFSGSGAAAVWLPESKLLLAGPAVWHGPRVPLSGTDTATWIEVLDRLAELAPAHVVPGFGSWGGAELISRQRRFLFELRRQVGYFIAQARPASDLQAVIRLVPDYLVWMPYDTPLAEDIDHLYQELTVPQAPFAGPAPAPGAKPAHALVLIGDQPHEPGHIEEGLRPVFRATGVVPHFAVDVRALSAENLARVSLLVILRDGLQRPQAPGQADYVWMTPEQEKAVVDFVHRGGGFLNLHNSMGLYPEDGPYLRLVGGRYIGHGPLERFRVEIVDRDHPITRGVEDFSVADEQHTPPIDAEKVHLLLRNRSDDGQTAAAGWAYEPGRGRLCHLANGHTRESLNHPMYQRLMRNAVLWCLRQEGKSDASPASQSAK